MHADGQKSCVDAPQRGEMKASNNLAELYVHNPARKVILKINDPSDLQFLF
jgi:hypothetical protein